VLSAHSIARTKLPPAKVYGQQRPLDRRHDAQESHCHEEPKVKFGFENVRTRIGLVVDAEFRPVEPMDVEAGRPVQQYHVPETPRRNDERPTLAEDFCTRG